MTGPLSVIQCTVQLNVSLLYMVCTNKRGITLTNTYMPLQNVKLCVIVMDEFGYI